MMDPHSPAPTLLRTKLGIPEPGPDLLARPRLLQRLDQGRRRRLTLVSAPAGSGKTSLVASWVRQLGADGDAPSPCWLSLDEGDTTLAGFWAYVVAALQVANPHLGAVLRAAFLDPQPPPIATVLAALINDLAALTRPVLLVLDDYHHVTAPEVHRALALFIERMPPTLRLVIVTREDPPLPLARLRARGQLAEIRAADLGFTVDESTALLNETLGLDLPEAAVATLAARTEGWAAGLRLASIALEQEPDRPGFIAALSASHRFLTDYLMDEVLARLDPALQRFLHRTAILQRLCPALCDAVLGIEHSELRREKAGMEAEQGSEPSGNAQRSMLNAQLALQRLEQANLFLIPLDHERHWYRYHHLFAELLRLRLQAAEPELIPVLTRRALDWCAAQGLQRDALGYALAVGDHPRAAALLEALAPEVLSHEGPRVVLHWLVALPESLVRQRPLLCAHAAWATAFAGQWGQ
ncbi:MAG: hypothetical protein HGA45_43545, partial [Chloroflexales bacterium]|nr:hypothetical protein [Chloroflexales bacterium]